MIQSKTQPLNRIFQAIDKRFQAIPYLDKNPPLRYGVQAALAGELILGLVAAYFAAQALVGGRIGEIFAIALTLIQATIGTLYLGGVVALAVWWAKRNPGKINHFEKFCHIFLSFALMGAVPTIGFLLPLGAVFIPTKLFKARVLRGTQLVSAAELKRFLKVKEQEFFRVRGTTPPTSPRLTVAGIELPSYLENLGYFALGGPGSGKSVSISELLSTLRQRSDFRAFIFDRNGEMMEKFYRPGDIIFNPSDARSVTWSHAGEDVRYETIAAALVPPDPKEPFFSDAARAVMSDLYEHCHNCAEIWEVLSSFSIEELQQFCQGGLSTRYMDNPKTAGSVLSTAANQTRFYRDLAQMPTDNPFSFVEWGSSEDTRWVWLPLFEADAELYKPLYSCCFELMLRGLLSNEGRKVQTAVVIDELGALNKLQSLSRLGAEARKFGGSLILGTQALAQIKKTYGEEDAQIIQTCTKTKLILNCPDPETAEHFSKAIGSREQIDITESQAYQTPLSVLPQKTKTQQIREVRAVMPSELQSLPSLSGYLAIADGTPPAQVKLIPRNYPKAAERLVKRKPTESMAQAAQVKMNLPRF